MKDSAFLHPSAHLPDLFVGVLRTGAAKGGLTAGARSPLLPWLEEVRPAGVESEQLVDVAPCATPRPPSVDAPVWLRVSVTNVEELGPSSSSAFSLRTISNLGFGFGQLPPW